MKIGPIRIRTERLGFIRQLCYFELKTIEMHENQSFLIIKISIT